MSKAISIRLDEQLLDDCKVYCKAQGISMTDMIISGLLGEIQGSQGMPDNAKSIVGVSDKVIKDVKDVPTAINQAINRPEYSRPTHHPTCKCSICKP